MEYTSSFRIAPNTAGTRAGRESLFRLLDKYPGCAGELMFFITEAHSVRTIDAVKECKARISAAVAESKKRGLKTGYNIRTTVGHFGEKLAGSQKGISPMVGIDGSVADGVICPTSVDGLEYVGALYRELAHGESNDFLWIDDDIRLSWHDKVKFGCFCDRCVHKFESETGVFRDNGLRPSRENLARLFCSADDKTRLTVRTEWLKFNARSLGGVLDAAAAAALETDPRLELGLMGTEKFYEYQAFGEYAERLKNGAGAVRFRPGGGFYWEYAPIDATYKAHGIGRQCACLPPYVETIQSEIENLPYQTLMKSVKMTAFESSVYLFAGCTGTSYNVFAGERLDEYERFFELAKNYGRFGAEYVELFGRSKPEGVGLLWNKAMFAAKESGEWPGPSGVDLWPYENIFEIGIPVSYSSDSAAAFIVTKEALTTTTDEEILTLLSKGLFLDGESLNYLNERGYGAYTGVKTVGKYDRDMRELMLAHELNGAVGNVERDIFQGFDYGGRVNDGAYALLATNADAEYVSHIIDENGKAVGYASARYVNPLGGRIFVSAFAPYIFCYDLMRSEQLKRVFNWLSGAGLKAYVKSFDRIMLWCSKTTDGGYGAAFANVSMDDTDAEIALKNYADKAVIRMFDGKQMTETEIRPLYKTGEYSVFRAENLKAFTVGFIAAI
jgi:hypothetical protein